MSSEYNTISHLESWSPDIRSLADTLLIGPQRELLREVNTLNNRHGLNLNITRTYRWSPGYMDQVKKWMNDNYIQPHMKRKVSTFFNQIEQKRWRYKDLSYRMNKIDNAMAEKRRVRSVFQDNSDLIADRWEMFYHILIKSIKEVNELFNGQIELYSDIVTNEVNKEYISLTWGINSMDMNIFVGNNPYPIAMGNVEVNLLLPITDVVMMLCSDHTRFDTDNPISLDTSGLAPSSYHIFSAWHESKYVNTTGVRLDHPFISRYAGGKYIDGNQFRNLCFGDLHGTIWSEFQSLNFTGMTVMLLQWNTTYSSYNTRPLNNVRQSFWGLPARVNTEEFINVYGGDPMACALPDYESPVAAQSIDYCDAVDCALKNDCNFYLSATGNSRETSSQEEEVRRDPQGRDIDRFDPIEVIRGLEVEIEDVPMSEEERVIAWSASQQGNLVNIRREQ